MTHDERPLDLVSWLRERPAPALGIEHTSLPARWADAGWGVRVALLDGAADLTHPDLADARMTRWPGVRGLPAPEPDPDATARATVLVGQGRRDVLGLVPAAHLLPAAVLGVTGHVADEVVARAVRWAVGEHAHVIVLPFGRRRLGRRVATTLRYALERGVVVLAAAGDLGADTFAFPASTTGVLAVTAHDDDGVLSGSSTRAELVAPGHAVPAGGAHGRTEISGSGAATVVAAGAWTALRSEALLRLVQAWPQSEAGQGQRLVDA